MLTHSSVPYVLLGNILQLVTRLLALIVQLADILLWLVLRIALIAVVDRTRIPLVVDVQFAKLTHFLQQFPISVTVAHHTRNHLRILRLVSAIWDISREDMA